MRPSRLKTLSTFVIIAGIVLTLVPLLWVAYTASRIGPAQAAALAGWEDLAADPAASAPRGQADPAAAQGLVLSIPRLRLTRYVPEGASLAQLRQFGVGRISWTALPDRPGIVGIAGHRTTYGAPFFRLAKLERGDHILVRYNGRQFDYAVTGRRIVRPAEVEVLRVAPGEHAVALITCTPLYSAKERLVVFGTLHAVSPLAPTP